MAMATKRLFVGNLHEDIQSPELESRFATFGSVKNVEVRTKNEAVFAFVDVEFKDEAGARRCVDVLNNTKWKGLILKVQIAKENFIEKLKKERAAAGVAPSEGKDYRQQYKARFQRPAKPDNFDFEIVSKSDIGKKSAPAKPEVSRPVKVERKIVHVAEEKPKPVKANKEPTNVIKPEQKPAKQHETPVKEHNSLTSENKVGKKSKTIPVPVPAANEAKPKPLPVNSHSKDKEVISEKRPSPAKLKSTKTKKVSKSEDESESSESSSDSEQERDGIPKFRGLGFYPGLLVPPIPRKVEVEPLPVSKADIKDTIELDEPGAPTATTPQEKPAFGLKLNPRKKAKSDQLRIQAVESRQRLQDTRSNVIRNALSKIDPETPVPAPDHKVSKANNDFLFGAEDDADDDNFSLAIKPQYEGTSGQKMLELKAKHGFDSRFQMDERFAEKSKRKNDSTDQELEKESQMEILGQILGPMDPGVRTPKPKPKIADQIMQFVRYDPTVPAHKVYEKTKVEVEGPAPKIRKIKDMEKPSEAKQRIEEEKEKLKDPNAKTTFKVAPNLKSLFTADPQQEKTFSLLKAFGGNTETQDEEEEAPQAASIEKPTNGHSSQFWSKDKKNPFKYDSSDTEDEDDSNSKKSKSKKIKDKKTEPAPASAPKNFMKQDLFKKDPLFFKNDDQRLQGVFDQFLAASEDLAQVTQEFNENGRSELKAIAKSKVKNSKRKNEKRVKIMKLVRKKKRREMMRKQKK